MFELLKLHLTVIRKVLFFKGYMFVILIFKKIKMAVKHIKEGKGEIHKGQKGGITGCGFDTSIHPDHWETTYEKINCNKNGCKN